MTWNASLSLDSSLQRGAFQPPFCGGPMAADHRDAWRLAGTDDVGRHGQWLLDSPPGLAGQHCMATLFCVTDSPLSHQRRRLALDVTREMLGSPALMTTAGTCSPDAQVVVRVLAQVLAPVLAPVVKPAMDVLKKSGSVAPGLVADERHSAPHLVGLRATESLP